MKMDSRGIADQILDKPYHQNFDEGYAMGRDYGKDMVTLHKERKNVKDSGLTYYQVLHPLWGNSLHIAFGREL